jgi:hypothetical protein
MQWAKVRGYSMLIAEGDSKLLVSALGKIINGASPDKVSKNWRLFVGLEEVAMTIWGTSVIIPSHVRRRANVVVDYLANVVVGQAQSASQWQWHDVGTRDLRDNLTRLNHHDTQLHDRTCGEGRAP